MDGMVFAEEKALSAEPITVESLATHQPTSISCPETIISNFEGEWRILEVKAEKSKIRGEMPPEWEDDSAWADVDVIYSRLTDHPFEGATGMRITASAIRSGAVLVRLPGVPLTPPYFVKASVALRSPSSIPVKFGVRKIGSPYSYYGMQEVTANPEWARHELLVPPVDSDPNACFMIEFSVAAVLEIDAVRLEYLTRHEVAGSQDFSGNLLRMSSFPDGIAPPWNPHHIGYQPEHYTTDLEVIGPTGQPALRISTVPYGKQAGIAGITAPFLAMGELDVTFSLWAKAEKPGHTIHLRMGPPSQKLWLGPYQKTVTLGTEWQRFSHTVRLPYAPDGFYLAQIMNWGPAGRFWVDGLQVEVGPSMGEFRRSGEVEAVMQPTLPYGLVEEGTPFTLRLTVYDQVLPGMVVKSHLFDVWGRSYAMPDIALTPPKEGNAFRSLITLPNVGEPPLGSYRLEYQVFDNGGRAVSKIGEVLLHRIRPAKYGDQFRPESPFGVHLTINSEMPSVMRRLGFTWARLFVTHWQSVEPKKGEWNFSKMDQMLATLHEAKFCQLGILEGVPEWARSWTADPLPAGYNSWHAKNVPPKDLQDFREYARRMAERYRGIVHAWETWNEPFLPGFLNIGFQDGKYIHPPPEFFFEMHQAAVEGIRAGSPEARIVFNGGAHYHAPADAWTRRLHELGIFDTVDVVSYHAYLPTGIGFPDDRIHQATAANANPHNPSMEVWNTEGGPGPSDVRNFYRHIPPLGKTDKSAYWGDYLIRYYVSTLASGAKKFFLYLMYGWGDYGPAYSMMNNDGRLAPCATALSNLAWHLEGRKYVKTFEPVPNLFGYLFEGEGGGVAIFLSKGVGRCAILTTLPKEKGVVRDLFGNELPCPVGLGEWAIFVEAGGMTADTLIDILQSSIVSSPASLETKKQPVEDDGELHRVGNR